MGTSTAGSHGLRPMIDIVPQGIGERDGRQGEHWRVSGSLDDSQPGPTRITVRRAAWSGCPNGKGPGVL
jgi:hypothetical protein